MNKLKIEHFKRFHNRENFLWYQECSSTQCNEIRQRLKRSFDLKKNVNDLLKLTLELDKLKKPVQGVNAGEENFSITNLIERLKLECNEDVYVNWNRYEDIDIFRLTDLSKYFDDIWYPASDNIEIFDESFLWVLFVDHDGLIDFIKT